MSTAAQHTEIPGWEIALASRLGVSRSPGLLVPAVGGIGKKTALMNVMGPTPPTFDASKMSASAIISRPNEDRSEDVVHPLGGKFANHQANPVVFFDHGFSGFSAPVAKSEDPDGKYTVKANKSGVEATSYFCPSSMESSQIFELVTFGIIRATSINLLPLVAKVRTEGREGYRPGLDVTEWELLEWSWVGIPDNPECLAKVHDMLSRGRLDDKPICEPLLKYFQPFAPEKRAVGKGYESHSCPTCGEKKMADDAKPGTDDTKPGSDKPVDDKEKKPEGGKPAGDESVSDETEKPTAKHLAGLHYAIAKVAAATRLCAKANEHPEAKAFLETQVDLLDGQAAEIRTAYAKCCPDLPALNIDADSDDDLAFLRKFLDAGQANRMRLQGILLKFERLSACDRLNAGDKALAVEATGRLSKMLGEARLAAQSKPADKPAVGDSAATVPGIDDKLEAAKALAKKLDGLSPAR